MGILISEREPPRPVVRKCGTTRTGHPGLLRCFTSSTFRCNWRGAGRSARSKDALVIVHVVEAQVFNLVRSHELCRLRVRRSVTRNSAIFFWVCASTMYSDKFVRQVFVLAARGDHQVINRAGVFSLGIVSPTGKLILRSWLVISGEPMAATLRDSGRDWSARLQWTTSSDVRFQFEQLLLHGIELFVGQVVELRRVGLVIAEDRAAMHTVERSSHTEIFPRYFGSQNTVQLSGGLGKPWCRR